MGPKTIVVYKQIAVHIVSCAPKAIMFYKQIINCRAQSSSQHPATFLSLLACILDSDPRVGIATYLLAVLFASLLRASLRLNVQR